MEKIPISNVVAPCTITSNTKINIFEKKFVRSITIYLEYRSTDTFVLKPNVPNLQVLYSNHHNTLQRLHLSYSVVSILRLLRLVLSDQPCICPLFCRKSNKSRFSAYTKNSISQKIRLRIRVKNAINVLGHDSCIEK